MALLMQHVTQSPQPPSAHNPSVPDELDSIVLRCLEKSPQDRYSSALDLRSHLMSIPLCETWSEEAAAAWWTEHFPDAAEQDVKQTGDSEETVHL